MKLKPILWITSVFLVISKSALPAQAEVPEPVWELNQSSLNSSLVAGKVEIVDGTVILDGSNTFSVPSKALDSQNDYTIEFEMKRSPSAKQITDDLFIFSNQNQEKKTGLGFKYSPPPYNAALLFINGYMTFEYRNILGDGFDKLTIVAKDKKLSIFRNGLILAITDTVHPSDLPIVFGQILKEKITPYELRNVKIYDSALFPTGNEQQAGHMMRFTSGDQYAMQRVEIKDPKLPRILVVGDSISMGYREFITEHFKGRAYVDYWVGGSMIDPNAVRGENSPVKRAWSGVLSNGPYDVVSWNAMTLHIWNPDMADRSPDESAVANMTEVVEFLKKTAPETQFIWNRCTPFTKPVEGQASVIDFEKSQRLMKRNTETDEIMKKYGIPEIDLFSLCEKNLDKASKDGVHWEKEASQLMAEEIIKVIEDDLSKSKKH